jgi:hypothetical protein
MPEPILVHYHLFKNAGTSLDRLLADSFGSDWVTFEGSNRGAQHADLLMAFLAARPGIRAVSSHLVRPPLPAPHCLPLIMLRHPIDRARSVFHFIRRDPVQPDHAAAARGGFADYVNWVVDNPGQGVAIRNYQVYHLSDASFRADNPDMVSTPDDLYQAQALIASWPAFGLTRAFGESCRLFNTVYAPLFPELDLRPVHENLSPDALDSEDEALDAARDELGATAFARLCAMNELDMALYAFARRLFANHVRGETWPIHEYGRAIWAAHEGASAILS